ncbi:MAG: hypothetical protein AB7D37_19350 [Desulfovibrio sp.]
MSFFLYVFLFFFVLAAIIDGWKRYSWFGPLCVIIFMSFIGYGVVLEILARHPISREWFNILPALVFFGLGVVSYVWVKYIPWGKRYGGAIFFGGCGISSFLLLTSK